MDLLRGLLELRVALGRDHIHVAGRRQPQVGLHDIHAGPGLNGIPRGTVKELREKYGGEAPPVPPTAPYRIEVEYRAGLGLIVGTYPVAGVPHSRPALS